MEPPPGETPSCSDRSSSARPEPSQPAAVAPGPDCAGGRSTAATQGLIGPRIRARVARGLARLPRTPQVRVARAILKRINEIYREEGELPTELKALIEAHCQQPLAEHGRGTNPAAVTMRVSGACWAEPSCSPQTRIGCLPPSCYRPDRSSSPRGGIDAGPEVATNAADRRIACCCYRPGACIVDSRHGRLLRSSGHASADDAYGDEAGARRAPAERMRAVGRF